MYDTMIKGGIYLLKSFLAFPLYILYFAIIQTNYLPSISLTKFRFVFNSCYSIYVNKMKAEQTRNQLEGQKTYRRLEKNEDKRKEKFWMKYDVLLYSNDKEIASNNSSLKSQSYKIIHLPRDTN